MLQRCTERVCGDGYVLVVIAYATCEVNSSGSRAYTILHTSVEILAAARNMHVGVDCPCHRLQLLWREMLQRHEADVAGGNPAISTLATLSQGYAPGTLEKVR